MNAVVFIIIVNWNGHQDTIECVNSVKKISYPNYKIVLVDNGSTDGSEKILRHLFPDITHIQTGKNLGFTGGNNRGIRHALDNAADYVILLNNDTIVDPAFVTEMVAIATADSTTGILCPKIFLYDRRDILWYAGASFYPWLGWGRHRGQNRQDRGQYDRVETTERATGCALMASKELCDTIGLLREEFFAYCEDTDWGMRARNAGYTIKYVPSSKVWHKVSRSTDARSGQSLYYFVRNMFLCLDTNKPLPFLLRQVRYGMIIIAAFLSFFSSDVPTTIGTVQICRGVKHFFQGTFGELKKMT